MSLQNYSITEEDILILYYIQKYKFLSVTQTHKVIATKMKKPSISRKLKRLQDLGFLNYFGNCRIGFSRVPKIYYITENGYNFLLDEAIFNEETLGVFRKKSKPTWSPVFMHRLMLIDVCISLELAIKDRPELSITKVLLDYNIDSHGHRETMDYTGQERDNIHKIIPDAAIIIKNTDSNKSVLFFIELDRGTETIRKAVNGGEDLHSIHYRMRKYDRYLLSRNYTKKYQQYGEIKSFILLFVTTVNERIENIRERMEDLPKELSNFYLFNSFEKVTENFFNVNWKNRNINDNQFYKLPGS